MDAASGLDDDLDEDRVFQTKVKTQKSYASCGLPR